jgi:DNA-binding NtrC family response regulator
MLVDHFIEEYTKQNPDKKVLGVTVPAMEIMKSYDWPGNVRELRNTMSRILSFMEGEKITPDDVPERIKVPVAKAELDIREDLGFKDAKEQWISTFEKQYLQEVLKRNNNNISATAKEAGIDRKSVQRLIKKYGLNTGGRFSDEDLEDDGSAGEA